jgi:DNA-binding NarL/FixJ family response regulator
VTRTGNSAVNPVTLVVADDHLPFLEGLARVLPELTGVRIVACCADGRAALAAITEHRPGVALLDLRMPLLGGREVLTEVIRRKLPTGVIVCSEHCAPSIIRAVLEEGARGYLCKDSGWDEIVAAVRAVAAGRAWVSPKLQAGLHDELSNPRRIPSVRELEVLVHASLGLTDSKVAERMHISRETVRTNLKRCSEKLGVSGRTALVAEALRRGMIE